MTDRKLLLLDLDGVVVLEGHPPLVEQREVLRLHSALSFCIKSLGAPVVVLTHRSRREAEHILTAAGVFRGDLAGVKAAEDLFRAGLHPTAMPKMLKRGLRKSLILPGLMREFGVAPADIAFIDDVASNLDDLLAHGIGLAMHAPSLIDDHNATFTSFDFEDVVATFQAWRGSRATNQRIALTPHARTVEPWRRTGLCTTAQGDHMFNRLRAEFARRRARLQSARS